MTGPFLLSISVFGRPFVKRFALCYRTVVCLSVCLFVCLSVTLVYCGQTVGWIKMKLGMKAGIDPGHIALDGYSAPPPSKGYSPHSFGPCLLWPNGSTDQDATWYEGRPRPRPHCVKLGPNSPSQKGQRPRIFGLCLLWLNGRPSKLLLSTCLFLVF